MFFENAGNQWSLSRPILSLIMTSEQVSSFYFLLKKRQTQCRRLPREWGQLVYYFDLFFIFVQMFGELRRIY
jgi:hypothetical protein